MPIFRNMCRKHCADTRNKAGAEIIPRFYCNIHPAEKQCKENNNQYRTADESDRLRYAAEYEIRVPCRNIAKLCQRLLTEKPLPVSRPEPIAICDCPTWYFASSLAADGFRKTSILSRCFGVKTKSTSAEAPPRLRQRQRLYKSTLSAQRRMSQP